MSLLHFPVKVVRSIPEIQEKLTRVERLNHFKGMFHDSYVDPYSWRFAADLKNVLVILKCQERVMRKDVLETTRLWLEGANDHTTDPDVYLSEIVRIDDLAQWAKQYSVLAFKGV